MPKIKKKYDDENQAIIFYQFLLLPYPASDSIIIFGVNSTGKMTKTGWYGRARQLVAIRERSFANET